MTTERIEPLPFQPPSRELLGLLRALEKSHEETVRILNIGYDWGTAELYGFGELTPLQAEALLSGRAR